MPLVPDHSASIRQIDGGGLGAIKPGVSIKHEEDPDEGAPQFDNKGALLRVEYPDGSIVISLDGRPLREPDEENPPGWFDNLCEKIDQQELARIADDLIRGVEEDLQSRQDWIDERAQGIKLLGLKIEVPNTQAPADGAPVEGMSKVRHPLLQEAVLRFQANARSELLPTDGPVKIRNDNNNATSQEDLLATALEKDFNHYLTTTASEYYPDTDKMLLMLGFGGSTFKKVYNCPLRNRPVSESVDANDLIVNDNATDLANAKRITHRVMMRPSVVRRLQLLNVYRDINLETPKLPDLDAVQQIQKEQQGIQPSTARPEDRDREIYESYCELDIKGFEHKHKGKVSGLEIPYRVTLDVTSREILSITRNYDEDTKELPEARENFVKYTFVPGFGFYDIGLVHILGNTTNSITAAWRELLDAGMFNNFPGFLLADTGARQATNIFRIPPGGAQLIKTGGLPITQAAMPLPYNAPSPALMTLVDNMAQTGQRVGGTSELQVGEGRPDAPVGTTLAMIEQATKVLNAVHKRMHSAQAQEFRLMARCFKENPEAFWQKNRKPTKKWDKATFLAALKDNDLTPQADPNTASHGQRLMKIMAVKQLQSQNPSLYDPIAVDRIALQGIGWNNPEQFFAPPQAQAAPPPELQQMQAEMQAKQVDSQAKMLTAQARLKEADARSTHLVAGATKLHAEAGVVGRDTGGEVGQVDTPVDEHLAETERMKAQSDMTVAQAKAQAELINAHSRAKDTELKRGQMAFDDAHHQEEIRSKHKIEAVNLAKELLQSHAENQRTAAEMHHDHMMKAVDMSHKHGLEERKFQQESAFRQQEHAAGREDAAVEREESAADRHMRQQEHTENREDAAADRVLKAKTAAKPKPKPKGKGDGK